MTSRVLIDHRRHSMRTKPGQHLSQSGVSLARRVGAGEFGPLPRYDRVVTSPIPRAFETAIAMGWAVGEQVERLWIGDDVARDLSWPLDLDRFADVARTQPRVATFLDELARLFEAIANDLPSGGAALVVSHGGVVEMSALALLPDASHESLRKPIGYAEGVRLGFEDGRCVGAEALRVSERDYLVEN